MVFTKRALKIIAYFYLIIFPFGQLLRVNFNVFGKDIPLHPIEVVSFLSFLIFVSKKKLVRTPSFLKSFIFISVFSLIFSMGMFPPQVIIAGSFYLLRLVGFVGVFFALQYILKVNGKAYLINSFVVIAFFTGVFGWLQYFLYPDLRALFEFGWDEHLYRLAGSFLDPGFTGIVLSLGTLLSLFTFLRQKRKVMLYIFLFLLLTTLFTYSRASILALIVGVGYLLTSFKKGKLVLLFTSLVIFLLLILPRPAGEGVKLERVFSINARVNNYKETITIIKQSPVFGVGFNNICAARQKYLGNTNILSHGCSGADSSILLVIATTGLVGFMLLIGALIKDIGRIGGIYRHVFYASSFAVLFHSLFVNSLFYPWVFGWLLGVYLLATE